MLQLFPHLQWLRFLGAEFDAAEFDFFFLGFPQDTTNDYWCAVDGHGRIAAAMGPVTGDQGGMSMHEYANLLLSAELHSTGATRVKDPIDYSPKFFF